MIVLYDRSSVMRDARIVEKQGSRNRFHVAEVNLHGYADYVQCIINNLMLYMLAYA